jgi:hypothetical protein
MSDSGTIAGAIKKINKKTNIPTDIGTTSNLNMTDIFPD